MKILLPKKIESLRALRRVMGVLIFFGLLFSPCIAGAVTQHIDPIMMNQIDTQSGGDTFLKNWLSAVSLNETGGAATWTARNAASSAIGPLQQLNAFRQGCAAAIGETYATLTANIGSADPNTASYWAVKCAIWYYRTPLRSCTTMASKLCGYFQGPGWCLGVSSRGQPPRPSSGGCGYDCRKAGIDCSTGQMLTDPDTGLPVVQPGAVNNPTTGQTGSINCQSLELAKAMNEAAVAFGNATIVNTRTVYEASPRSDIRNTQCLTGGFFNYFDIIRSLLAGINVIVTAINAIVASILRQICAYIANSITNLINAALSLLCIPSLSGLNFGLGSFLPTHACSGISLLTFGSGSPVGATGGSPPFLSNISRGIPGSGGSFRF